MHCNDFKTANSADIQSSISSSKLSSSSMQKKLEAITAWLVATASYSYNQDAKKTIL